MKLMRSLRLPAPVTWMRLCGAVLLAAMTSPAQLLQGTIDGNVTDPSGAVIAGASIIATEEATHFERTAVTASTGAYALPNLPPGSYTLTASAPGFHAYKVTGIPVTVQTVTRADIKMTVGDVSQSVTVAADAATLETDRADVHSALGTRDLSNLPIPIGRNYQMLFVTVPGVLPPQNGHSFGANSTRTLSFTVNGGNVNANDIRVDGAGTRTYSATDVS